ncbi:unnamed protein product [Cuscuta epithymum]|uniref:C3H1-type domain-containing protein n=1 Tax=Cuscuta epithymum TaxID=186058 RepID=A0AAV0DMZ5_9ASTE|nr:unnamed protein product [Cuscuta epithymum]
MSFPDLTPPPPPHSFVSLPYAGGDMASIWPPLQMKQEHLDLYPQYENEPPFKRSRSSDTNPPNSATFQNLKVNPPNLPGKGSNHIFYKTRMCMKFLEGSCRNGEHCTFAHGPDDLREPPPNWQDIIREKDRGAGNWNSSDQKAMHRMKICKKYYNGEECPYGERCNFLHERSPQFIKNDITRDQRDSSAIRIGTSGNMLGKRGDSDQFEINQHSLVDLDTYRIKPTPWKTRICSKWEITGVCPFGDRCHYAHGQSELGSPAVRNEIEATSSFASIQIKPHFPVVDQPHANVVPCPQVNEQHEEGKKFLKWKPSKKICPIYADWIDDLVPPHLLAGKVEAEF